VSLPNGTYGRVLAALRDHLVEEVLDGEGDGLDAGSPLLEWGILNSMEIVKLLKQIERRFGVKIPERQVIAANFRDLDTITRLVLAAGVPGS
jgi:acyl carrier protein